MKAAKREEESFSDVVRRLTAGAQLQAFHGALAADTADDLETVIEARRDEHEDRRDARMSRLEDTFEES